MIYFGSVAVCVFVCCFVMCVVFVVGALIVFAFVLVGGVFCVVLWG